jgi:hypothetical protein
MEVGSVALANSGWRLQPFGFTGLKRARPETGASVRL